MDKKQIILILSSIIVLGFVIFWGIKNPVPQINSFEDCVKAGYPILESYPEQCRTRDGKFFVNPEQIINQQNNMNESLKIEDLSVGTGDKAENGKTVFVNYLGTFIDGKKFDSSYDRNQPFSFTLGAGQVIQGWEQGILGMQVGGKRKLTIGPDLAYGAGGIPGAIPPNSTLIFEVELLEVR